MTTRPLVFMGSKAAGLAALTRLIDRLPKGAIAAVACPDDTDDARSVAGQFEILARQQALPLVILRSRASLSDFIGAHRPAAAIVHGWYRIIPVADFPETEFYGFHYSPLPRYRGNAPLVWQIINGEPQIGISFFQLDEGFDDGPLLDQRFFPLGGDDTIADALSSAQQLVDDMLDQFAIKWQGNKLSKFSQPAHEPSYCGMRVPDDGRINWTWPAKQVHDFIRAQAKPYPGAFSVLPDGRRLTIWSARIEPRRYWGAPGGVLETGKGEVVVACGSGAIVLMLCQVDDDLPVSADGIIKSMKMRLL